MNEAKANKECEVKTYMKKIIKEKVEELKGKDISNNKNFIKNE